MKAHRSIEDMCADDCEDWQAYAGNCIADMFAGIAAKKAQLDLDTRSGVKKIHAFAYLTLARLACAEWVARQAFQWRRSWELSQATAAVTVDAASGNLVQAIAAQGHSLVQLSSDRFRCINCSTTRTRRQFLFFAQVKCGDRAKPGIAAKLGAVARTTIEWYGHRLTRATFTPVATYACLRCKASGQLSDFDAKCKDHAEDWQGAAGGMMQGTYQAAKRKNRDIAVASLNARKVSEANQRAAAFLYMAGLPHPAKPEEQRPTWLAELGCGHNLWHARGLVYCKVCGCVASSPGTAQVLKAPCRAAMPAGSRGRLAKLRKGVHPHAGAKSWPDGTSAKEIAHFRRVPQSEHHEFADKVVAGELAAASGTSDDDYGERVVCRLAPRRLNAVSEEVAGRVARAIDALLHQYLDSITDYPENGHLTLAV